MKKTLPLLTVLLALGAAGAAVYLYQKQIRAGGSAERVDTYLPAETQLLLSLPDLDGTLSNWKTTDLYKIWMEPEVRDFLAKPLSKLPPHKDFDDTWTRIVGLSPKNVFVAITTMDEKTNQPHVIAGFDFQGDKAEVETLLADAKEGFRRKSPAGKADLVNYQGHALETFDGGDGNSLASTYLDHRYLVSNDLALLKSTIDLCDHRAPANGGKTLDKDGDYQTVLGKLPGQHETLIFARPQALLHRLSDLSAAAGQPMDDARRAELDKLKAAGATTRIENGKLRDTLFYLAPGMNQDLAKLQMSSMPLTSPATLFYAASMFDLPAQLNLPEGPPAAGTPASGVLTGLIEIGAMLRDHGITLDRFRAAFGNEASAYLDWPGDRLQPALIATVEVRDPAAASKFVDDLTNTSVPEAEWQFSDANGVKFHTLMASNISFINPTLTLTDKHLIFGLNPPEVREAARREQSGGPNFTAGETYKTTAAMVVPPNEAFIYLDCPALFERVYGTVRGVALFGAALVYPQLGEYIDLTKLPSPQAISKHLSPTVYSQKIDGQGGLVESVGSVTVGQAAFAVLGVAGAAAVPLVQNQFGGAAAGMPPPKRAPVTPASPANSPASTPPQPDGNE